jgi:hypothetical protein
MGDEVEVLDFAETLEVLLQLLPVHILKWQVLHKELTILRTCASLLWAPIHHKLVYENGHMNSAIRPGPWVPSVACHDTLLNQITISNFGLVQITHSLVHCRIIAQLDIGQTHCRRYLGGGTHWLLLLQRSGREATKGSKDKLETLLGPGNRKTA